MARDLELVLDEVFVFVTPSTLGGLGNAVPEVNQSSLEAPNGSLPDEEAKGSALLFPPPNALANGSLLDEDADAGAPKGSLLDAVLGALGIGGGLKLFLSVREKGSPLLLIMEAGPDAAKGSGAAAEPELAAAKGSFEAGGVVVAATAPAAPNALLTGAVKGSSLSLKGSAPLISNGSP